MGCDGDVLVRYDMIVCVRLKMGWCNTVSFFLSPED